MKVTAFVGSARKKHTYCATKQFVQNLQKLGDIESEIISLSDYNLNVCRGCCVCFLKGEEFCPLKDDRDKLFEKIYNSDGIVFASPNYSYHVSGQMKLFLDRLGFVFHRPRYFGKTFTNIVVQGIYGGGKIVKYLDFVGEGLGFNVVHGCCLKSLEPMTEEMQTKNDRKLDHLSRQFYSELMKAEYPSPTLFKLMGFRMARTSMRLMLTEKDRDFTYYRDKGWFESDYYYPVRLNPLQKLSGWLFDKTALKRIRSN